MSGRDHDREVGDVIDAGAGTDTVDGQRGTDTGTAAEVVTSCEVVAP